MSSPPDFLMGLKCPSPATPAPGPRTPDHTKHAHLHSQSLQPLLPQGNILDERLRRHSPPRPCRTALVDIKQQRPASQPMPQRTAESCLPFPPGLPDFALPRSSGGPRGPTEKVDGSEEGRAFAIPRATRGVVRADDRMGAVGGCDVGLNSAVEDWLKAISPDKAVANKDKRGSTASMRATALPARSMINLYGTASSEQAIRASHARSGGVQLGASSDRLI
jgi:hypothetical protein